MVVWIFGYASLIWKAGFEYDERVVGFIKGYRRAFHLACFEHRGTAELPARVATLEQDEDAICWGAAYCIKGADAAKRALAYLHVRECEYNKIDTFKFYTEDSPDKVVIPEVQVFMSTNDSKYYLGGAPHEEIAMQIAVATGPSGPNCDYLFRLVEALREIGHEDAEVIELANAVRRVRNEMTVEGVNALRTHMNNCSNTLAVISTLSQSSASVLPKSSVGEMTVEGVNALRTHMNNCSNTLAVISTLSQSSASVLPKSSVGVQIHGINSASLNHMPGSPRLVKSQVS